MREKKAHKYKLNGSFRSFFSVVVWRERERSIRSSKHMYDDDYFKVSISEFKVGCEMSFAVPRDSTRKRLRLGATMIRLEK